MSENCDNNPLVSCLTSPQPLLEYFLLKYGLSWLHDDGAYFGFDIKLILYISNIIITRVFTLHYFLLCTLTTLLNFRWWQKKKKKGCAVLYIAVCFKCWGSLVVWKMTNRAIKSHSTRRPCLCTTVSTLQSTTFSRDELHKWIRKLKRNVLKVCF